MKSEEHAGADEEETAQMESKREEERYKQDGILVTKVTMV